MKLMYFVHVYLNLRYLLFKSLSGFSFSVLFEMLRFVSLWIGVPLIACVSKTSYRYPQLDLLIYSDPLRTS
jgi:hypothetical protein